MYDKLATRYRAKRDDELDLAERARTALHASGWEHLNPSTPSQSQNILAGVLPRHVQFAPDTSIDVYAVDRGEPSYVIVASDGSQVMPDTRHRYPMAAVHVATVRMAHDASYAPPGYRTYEWTPDDPQIIDILMSGERTAWMTDAIGSMRDAKEIETLVLAANDIITRAGVDEVAMLDGPLHIYNEGDVAARGKCYKDIRDMGAFLAGVVDQGEARYVAKSLAEAHGVEDFANVRDIDLFGNLLPGQRSALFDIKSRTNQQLGWQKNGFAIGFFYLNVGDGILRIETTTDLGLIEVNQLARIIMAESAGIDYPYILRLAHELAVISDETRQSMVMMHRATLTHYALGDGFMSHKETLKTL